MPAVIRIGEIIDRVLAYNPDADTKLIEKAYVFSAMAHQGQVRRSGEPYLSHPLEVAGILATMKMDSTTIAASLLHDAPEDTDTPIAQIEDHFGNEIASLVEGVTKISKVAFATSEEREAENFRKMVLAMAKDVRVILIKLADRLHNVRTLDPLSALKKARIARETLEIYAPLANRLGIAWLKSELEDLSFHSLDPETYENIHQWVAKRYQEREKYIEEVKQEIAKTLEEANIQAEVVGRAKHFYSIWHKMQMQHIPFEEVYDLTAIRIITGSVRDCYAILGTIHSIWTPVPGRFKDYVAMPKANMYQSLHTTVVGPGGERVEFQIRTHEMHAVAQYGIAAHWKYKEEAKGKSQYQQRQGWIKGLLEWQKDLKDPREFLETVKGDLFPDEVYTFTPQGEVKAFPRGATPVDFAYAVHTDIGHSCVGAKINGRLVPLRYELNNGDMVEIMTAAGHTPSKDWLKFVRSPRARTKIKSWIKLEQRTRSIALGKEILDKELRKRHQTLAKLSKSETFETVLTALGLKSVEDLWANIGYGKMSPWQVARRLAPEEELRDLEPGGKESKLRDFVKKFTGHKAEDSVKIGGLERTMVRFALCCNPVPGDQIVGFITRGRGVSIHTADCPNVEQLALDPERKIEVDWAIRPGQSYPVRILVESLDRPGILAAVSAAIADTGINITGGQVTTTGGRGVNELEIEIRDLNQLQKVTRRIEKVKGVTGVRRLRSMSERRKTES